MRRLALALLFAGIFSALLPALVFAATRTLTLGMSGSDVTAVQQILINKGYLSASATGYFGSATLAAVKKFQCDQQIVCSGSSYGTVGPHTQAALGGSGSIGTSGVSVNGKAMEVGGWIPYWRTATGTADVLPHLSGLTEISPFVFTLKSDGTIYDAGNITQEPWASFITAAKAAHVRVVPTVMSGDGSLIMSILSNSTKRVALEVEIANLVKQNNFDGIDIDFEGKPAESINYFSTFLKGLYQRMGTKWVYCSIEPRTPVSDRYDGTPPQDATVYANDYTQINKYCDRVELMTYDQGAIDVTLNKARAAPYVPVADPSWVASVVGLAEKQIDKKKILLGIATYGYEYSVTPLTEYGYQYDLDWAFNPKYATDLAVQLGITPVRNAAGELSFIYKASSSTQTGAQAVSSSELSSASQTNNDLVGPGAALYSQAAIAGSIQPPFNLVWWSDAQAISNKVALAQQLGIKGVAVFKFDGGEDQGLWQALPPAVH